MHSGIRGNEAKNADQHSEMAEMLPLYFAFEVVSYYCGPPARITGGRREGQAPGAAPTAAPRYRP